MIQRSFRYRLSPTPEQAERLAKFAGVTRFIYNLALEQRSEFWRQFRSATGRTINSISQSRDVTKLRAQVDWIGDAPATALNQALRDLDRAFSAFFSGRSGYPTPRRKGRHDRFRVRGCEVKIIQLNAKWSAVHVPKLGFVKFRNTRAMRGECVNVTFSKCVGNWFVSFSHEIEHVAPERNLPSVGIDRGVANTLALSTGEMLSTPDTTALERERRRAQRILCRRQRGSRRYAKQRRRFARIAAKIVRVRADWRHRASLNIAERFGTVAIEALKIVNMTAKGRGKNGLNRAVREQGWYAFERVLAYKLEERGGSLVKVNSAYTSQECSACGTIDRASRKNQASFACRHCGFAIHADMNAAINILRRSTPSVEGAGCGPDEARTINLAA